MVNKLSRNTQDPRIYAKKYSLHPKIGLNFSLYRCFDLFFNFLSNDASFRSITFAVAPQRQIGKFCAMRVECPVCTVAYEIPPSLLTTQRRLRCAGCGHEWWLREPEAVPDAPPEPPPPLSAPRVADIHEPAAPRQPSSRLSVDPATTPRPTPRTARAIWAGWAASILLLLLAAWAGEHYRQGIMRAWPPSERLFAAIGQGEGGPR